MQHAGLITAVTLFSAALFVASLLGLPWFLARIPADYFQATSGRPPSVIRRRRIGLVLWVLKNALGVVLLLAGIAMLVLPGQGLLTLVVALVLLDVPGKRRLVRSFVSRPRVLQALNGFRRRAGQPPLILD